MEKLKTYNESFLKASILHKKLHKKKFPSDDLIFLNDLVLSQKLPKKDYLNFISLLNSKINKKTFAEKYFTQYRNVLTGIKYIVSGGAEYDYPNYSKEISEILKKIFAFIYLLDTEGNLIINSFYASILFYAIDIAKNKGDKNFYEKLNVSEIDKCVVYLINSFNSGLK